MIALIEITFIRHGEIESNLRHAYVGWTDKPLTENGREQAKYVAKRLKNVKFDAIYTSPLIRAKETAKIIADSCHTEVIEEERLKEWNFGIFDDYNGEEIKEKFPLEYQKWQKDFWHYKIPGGENAAEVYERNVSAIGDIIKRHPEGGKICVVSHLCVLRNIFTNMLGMKLEDAHRFRIKNATVNKICINNEGYASLSAFNS